jgi:hypothetical protein
VTLCVCAARPNVHAHAPTVVLDHCHVNYSHIIIPEPVNFFIHGSRGGKGGREKKKKEKKKIDGRLRSRPIISLFAPRLAAPAFAPPPFSPTANLCMRTCAHVCVDLTHTLSVCFSCRGPLPAVEARGREPGRRGDLRVLRPRGRARRALL